MKDFKLVIRKRLFWSVKLIAKNGETVMTSETYFKGGNANRAALRLSEALGLDIERD